MIVLAKNILQAILYPKALLLIGVSLLILIWLIYFSRCVLKQNWHALKTLYTPYISYIIFIIFWILSNAYFHTNLLVWNGNNAAVYMAKAANLFSYSSFTLAFLFSCRLTSKRPSRHIKIWQKSLITIATGYVFYINLMPNITVTNVVINGPSDFSINFGNQTTLFFTILFLFTSLTLYNFMTLRKENNKVKKIKSDYMIVGITTFMLSTITFHIIFPIFLNNFDYTWLPPAFSSVELICFGYAITCNRFYSWKYILFIAIRFSVTAIVYTVPIYLLRYIVSDSMYLLTALAYSFLYGKYWNNITTYIGQYIHLFVTGDKETTIEKISALSNDFKQSSDNAIKKLSKLLNMDDNKEVIIIDISNNNNYTNYLSKHDAALLLDEITYHYNNTSDKLLNRIKEQMNENQAAMVLPLYDDHHSISHLLIAPQKKNDAIYPHEEISAIQTLLKEVQGYIQNEYKVKQSQALAKSIAHEIRNPLAQIQLHIEKIDNQLICYGATTELRKEVQYCKEALEHGNQLVEIMLHDIAQPDKTKTSLQQYFVSQLIKSTLKRYAGDFSTLNKIQFISQYDFKINVNITMFEFVLFNLLKNAIYYFDEYANSTITISLEQFGDYNLVHFTDYGPGIEPQIQQRIFDNFFTYQKRGGTGLGLSYCQRVMKLFGGKIQCHSVYGEFTTFSLWFPVITADFNIPSTIPPMPNLPTYKALVTDDQKSQRLLMRLYLEQLGLSVVEAHNGQQAIEAVQKHEFDIVFMDIQMPVLNGLDACLQIKRNHPELPVIALSGESNTNEVDQINQLMDDRLLKPVNKQVLQQAITKWLATDSLTLHTKAGAH
ncbi:hybrid sensor histidine kinase/response regulator [Celerinatantimonas yamalensis]|uniref:histidine kinase n=1 Tax=Celerinatantimonas yamalensis TaxID=559956 RepID=A0ABW9G995_9GAMM